MSDYPGRNGDSDGSDQGQKIIVVAAISVAALILGFIILAIVLVLNPDVTSAAVEVIRDLFIIVVAFAMLLIFVAVVVLLIQVARFVNLMTNEVKPIIDTASDTVNTVRGTAEFVSRHVTQPIVTTAGALNGISKVVGDVDMIRKAAGIVMEVANSSSTMSTRAHPNPAPEAERNNETAVKSTSTSSELSEMADDNPASIKDNF